MKWDDPLDFKKEGIVLDYKTAGVDIDAGNKFVEDLKTKVPTLGGFGGMIKVPSGYEEPILVSGADGVGTKIEIANILNKYDTIGIDLVAMCVNDLLVQGAIIETKENQSGSQLSRIVRIMGEVGVDQAIITDVQKDKP